MPFILLYAEQMPKRKRPAQNNLQDDLMEGDSQNEDVPQDLKRGRYQFTQK